MATSYKTFTSSDVVSTKTLLHESIPLTGTVLSGTYQDGTAGTATETNIKNYTHGMFQSVYDYPYLSSSANHILDLTMGYSARSPLSQSSTGSATTQQAKKINIYNQMAQVLMGHDAQGNIQDFDKDGDLAAGTQEDKIRNAIFINLSRLLTKDEIKKGTFSITLGVNPDRSIPHQDNKVKLSDYGAATDYRVNSPAGDYGILYADSSEGTNLTDDDGGTDVPAGLIFYQAGVAVLNSRVFLDEDDGGIIINSLGTPNMRHVAGDADGADSINTIMGAQSIQTVCDAVRHRIVDITFNNTTELNSTIYFCRANHNEFNYSSNPTYTSNSQLVVKNLATDSPVSYITTVGLYSSDNELMAVAKLSEPLKKSPTNELTLRVRLDY
tara:strand:+ start:2076 stop:3224 length:1149 start_codon:yes stop_codon:yes gene_type:complete